MIANSACLCFILNQQSVTFHYTFIILILIIQSANKLKLPKTQTPQISIFHLSRFFFWTRNNSWTNSLIAMQAPFVIYIIPEADSGLVKLVVMTNVFFNKQQHEIKIKRFIFVKYIKSRFFCNSWNQCFHSACKTWRSVFAEGTIKENLMQLSEKYLIYKQRVRDGQMGITSQFLDDIPGSYGEAASLSYCSARGQYWWENVRVGVLLTPLIFH